MGHIIPLFIVVMALIGIYVLDVQSLKVIPQKVNITYINHKYIGMANLTIKRYGRKSDYYLNLDATKYHTWDNNVSFSIIFNEYLHNEYRRSFVEMSFKVCDLINKDVYIGRMIAGYGITCPVLDREVHFRNMTVPANNFPYEFPFERARLDGVITITQTGERVAEGHMFTLFKKNSKH